MGVKFSGKMRYVTLEWPLTTTTTNGFQNEQLAGELSGMRGKYGRLKKELKSMQHKLEVRRPPDHLAAPPCQPCACCQCGLLEKYKLLKGELKAAYYTLEVSWLR